MQLGGVQVDDRLVRKLSDVVDRPLGHKLDLALLLRAEFVGLTTQEKSAILAALENPPPGLEPVREALLADPGWHLPRGRL